MTWSLQETDPLGLRWKEFLDRTPHLLFHEGVWAGILRAGISSRVVCLLFHENGEPKSGTLGFILGGLGIRIAYFNYPYGSIIGTPPPTDVLTKLLREYCRRHRVCQLQLVGYPGVPEIDHNYFDESQSDRTHILDLEGFTPETLWNGYRRSRRQDIRKARERGIVVEETTSDRDIELVYDFYLQTMRRTGGVARYKKQLIHAIVTQLSSLSLARLYIARINGKAIAGMLIVDSSELSHGLLLASSDEARSHQPNKLLLHTAAEACIHNGNKGLDYMPSGQSASGVSNFKNLWGAEEVKLKHLTLRVLPFRSLLWRTAYLMAKHQPARGILAMFRHCKSL